MERIDSKCYGLIGGGTTTEKYTHGNLVAI